MKKKKSISIFICREKKEEIDCKCSSSYLVCVLMKKKMKKVHTTKRERYISNWIFNFNLFVYGFDIRSITYQKKKY